MTPNLYGETIIWFDRLSMYITYYFSLYVPIEVRTLYLLFIVHIV